MAEHIVSVSGGKDSAACYMLAMMRGKPFRAVTADTGHEHPITYEWISKLSERTGGPKIEIVRYDFAEKIARKRTLIKTKWVDDGVDSKIIEAALDATVCTGNPFLDLCIWKGRFPSRRAQFCTEWLKSAPIYEQVFYPAREKNAVFSWQGERREESHTRSNLPRFQRNIIADIYDQITFRPIVHWSAQNVFDLFKYYGLEPNPLYKNGMKRVGCFPCVNASKEELRHIFLRFAEILEKLKYYERMVANSSKLQQSTFFAAKTTPQGARLAKDHKNGLRLEQPYPSITDIKDWSQTSRGGVQITEYFDDGLSCTSQYGLCE